MAEENLQLHIMAVMDLWNLLPTTIAKIQREVLATLITPWWPQQYGFWRMQKSLSISETISPTAGAALKAFVKAYWEENINERFLAIKTEEQVISQMNTS
jgi:hypothetical protein